MADLTVIVPSRGRPEAAHELVKAFDATCSADTQLVFAIDERDQAGIYDYPYNERATTLWWESTTMVEALNQCAVALATGDPRVGETLLPPPFALGFMGDDHRPQSVGWDRAYLDALRDLGTGLVYGDDLLQRQNLPTQVAMTADIVRALGFMAPPTLTHLYVDNFWKDLGIAAGCLRYLPDVVVEHRHPVAGKAQWDANYARVNDSVMYERDARAYELFVGAGELHSAVDAVKALRHG